MNPDTMPKGLAKSFDMAKEMAERGLRKGVNFTPTLFAHSSEKGKILCMTMLQPDGQPIELNLAQSLMSAATAVVEADSCVSLHHLHAGFAPKLTLATFKQRGARREDFSNLFECVLLIAETREEICFHVYHVVRFDNQTFASLSLVELTMDDSSIFGGRLAIGILLPANPPEAIVECARLYLAAQGLELDLTPETS